MTCYHPLSAYRSFTEKTEGGKNVITFKPPSGPFEPMKLPCGQCIGCRLDKSKEWALRCVHEASLHTYNSFLTLTYSEENVPEDGSLCKPDYQRFLKRLRKTYPQEHIKYFLCGEYGAEMLRPHFHCLLFNHDFLDKQEWSISKGNVIYRSNELEKLWPHGYSWIGDVTWQSAAYVARYVLKKVNGPNAIDRYVKDVDLETGECRYLEPEFIAMSRKPPIAEGWFEKFSCDTRKDYLTHEGKSYKLPRYYDKLMSQMDERHYDRMKEKRKKMAKENAVDGLRLRQMEQHQEQSAKRLERVL